MIELQKNGARASIATLGAEMRAYATADGRQRLWSGDPAVWGGVSPNLFPVIGHLKEGTVRIEGKPCVIPMHGIALTSEFAILQQDEDFCALQLTDTPESRAAYPFAFSLKVTHRLTEHGFATNYFVQNRDARPMPFTLGGHPGFRCPMNPGERFEDYRLVFDKPESGNNLRVEPGGLMGDAERLPLLEDGRVLPLDYALFDRKDTLVLAGLQSDRVELRHQSTGKGLRFTFPRFTTLSLWTKPHAHAPYVCLEPWIGVPAFVNEDGDFESKPYHVSLAPGQTFEAWYTVETLD